MAALPTLVVALVASVVADQEAAEAADQDPATGAVANEADQDPVTRAVSPGALPVADLAEAAEVAEVADQDKDHQEAADQDHQEVELIAGLSPTYPVKWEEKSQPENK